MTGPTQLLAMFRKSSPTTAPNVLANQLLPQPHLMLIFSTALPLVHPSLHASISVTKPPDWYSKSQATVETATYGSELVAAKTATEQIMDLRFTLRYLGVPIKSKCYMFGDNKCNDRILFVNSAHDVWGKRCTFLFSHVITVNTLLFPQLNQNIKDLYGYNTKRSAQWTALWMSIHWCN